MVTGTQACWCSQGQSSWCWGEGGHLMQSWGYSLPAGVVRQGSGTSYSGMVFCHLRPHLQWHGGSMGPTWAQGKTWNT